MAKLFRNLTLQQKYKLYLESVGYVQVDCRTTKYIAMQHPLEFKVYFLGKAGAIRSSDKGTISDSRSVKLKKEPFEKFCLGMEGKHG